MDRVPDKIIVKGALEKYVVCVLLEVRNNVPFYGPDQFRVFEHFEDAVRAVNEAPKEKPL